MRAVPLALLLLAPPLAGQDAPPAPSQSPVAGAAVFGEKGCVRCHTVTGSGESIGPDLRSETRSGDIHGLMARLWNHIPGMSRRMEELGVERPRLTAREAGDLVAYLFSLGYLESAGDPGRGRQVFSDQSCIRCHRVGGVGGVIGPDLDLMGARGTPIEMATAMWNHGPEMSEAARRRDIPRPRLTGRDVADLLAYLKSEAPPADDIGIHLLPGRPQRGRAVLEEKQCVQCHGVPGGGGRSAPDLTRTATGTSMADFMAAMWAKAPIMIPAIERRGIEFPRLSPDEVADIVALLRAEDYFGPSGSAARGRIVIRSSACLSCHAPGAAGEEAAVDLEEVSGLDHPASLIAALWNHVPVGPGEGGSWPDLSPADMADLMAYFHVRSGER